MSIPAQGAVGAETMTAGQSLDLRDLHAANIARQAEWCPDQVPDLSFRGNELGGECGEAQNVIKKLERERQGWRGSRATKDDLADELADVVICADLCAVTADIDLGAAVRRKFNATSEKQGLSVFLPLPTLASPRADSDERTAGEDVRLPIKTAPKDGTWIIGWQDVEASYGGKPANIIRWHEGAWTLWGWGETREPTHWSPLATPAQPAGAMPDSLREAFARYDAAFEKHERAIAAHGDAAADISASSGSEEVSRSIAALRAMYAAAVEVEGARVDFVETARTLLASHPAGQSAGSGADLFEAGRRLINDWERAPKLPPKMEEALTRFEKVWLALNDGKPAPDSTRTGQGEAEAIARAAYVRICRHEGKEGWRDAGEAFDTRNDDGGSYLPIDSAALELAMAIAADALAARPAAPEAQGLERVRHVKRGTEYEVLGEAVAQIATRSTCPDGPGNGVLPNSSVLREGDKLTVYRGSDGKLWCRFTDEFRDGRFTPTNPPLSSNAEPAPPASSGQGER